MEEFSCALCVWITGKSFGGDSLTYLLKLTYLLTPWSKSPSWEANRFSASQKTYVFYGTRRFITTLTSAHHLSLSTARSIQSVPTHPTSWRSILILFSYLSLGLPSGLFPTGFYTKTLYTPHLSPIRATCSTHLILDFITGTALGEEYRSLSSSLCSFLHFPCYLVPLRPKYSPQHLGLKHPQPTFLP